MNGTTPYNENPFPERRFPYPNHVVSFSNVDSYCFSGRQSWTMARTSIVFIVFWMPTYEQHQGRVPMPNTRIFVRYSEYIINLSVGT